MKKRLTINTVSLFFVLIETAVTLPGKVIRTYKPILKYEYNRIIR